MSNSLKGLTTWSVLFEVNYDEDHSDTEVNKLIQNDYPDKRNQQTFKKMPPSVSSMHVIICSLGLFINIDPAYYYFIGPQCLGEITSALIPC